MEATNWKHDCSNPKRIINHLNSVFFKSWHFVTVFFKSWHFVSTNFNYTQLFYQVLFQYFNTYYLHYLIFIKKNSFIRKTWMSGGTNFGSKHHHHHPLIMGWLIMGWTATSQQHKINNPSLFFTDIHEIYLD